MLRTFNAGSILPIYRPENQVKLKVNTDALIYTSDPISPFKHIYSEQLTAINEEAKSLNNSELVLNICGCGHLTETFLLPALEQVINQVPDLRQKLKLILTDAASIYELAGTKNGAGIESVLRNMRVDYEYCASGTLGMDRLSSIKGVFNATPPALHLPTCEYYVGNTGAPI